MELINEIDKLFEMSEGIASARDKYESAIGSETINSLAAIDPTPQKKYTEWMASKYAAGERDLDAFKVIRDFDELAGKGIIKDKDILVYKSLAAIESAVKSNKDKITISAQKKGIKGLEGINPADIVFQNNKAIVVKPTTKEASIKYGRGAHWCTAAMGKDNMFNRYYVDQEKDLYYILPTEFGEIVLYRRSGRANSYLSGGEGSDKKVAVVVRWRNGEVSIDEIRNYFNDSISGRQLTMFCEELDIPTTTFQPASEEELESRRQPRWIDADKLAEIVKIRWEEIGVLLGGKPVVSWSRVPITWGVRSKGMFRYYEFYIDIDLGKYKITS